MFAYRTLFCTFKYIDVDYQSNTWLGSMMVPVMSGYCTFQMTLKGLSPDTSELALQLFATVSHETETDDPEWAH